MASGKPFISSENVRAALEALLYTSQDAAPNPLYSLLLVDEILVESTLPPASRLREFILRDILVALIAQQYTAHRRVLHLPSPQPDETLNLALEAVRLDATTDKPELLGWSYFYYRYVRVELSLSPEAFEAAAHIHERTLRRYQKHVIERIVESLIEVEAGARTRQRQRRLYAALPITPPIVLYGREKEFNQAHSTLVGDQMRHLHITASTGGGKQPLHKNSYVS